MDDFVITYIDLRMKQLGHKHYNIEPYLAVLDNTKTEFHLPLGPEFLFLQSKELPVGTEIIADNNYFKVENYYSYMNVAKVQEFSGQMEIKIPPGSNLQLFEFIRVIPNDFF
jgi:hypothetical protein